MTLDQVNNLLKGKRPVSAKTKKPKTVVSKHAARLVKLRRDVKWLELRANGQKKISGE